MVPMKYSLEITTHLIHVVLLVVFFMHYCRAIFKREDLHLSVVNKPRVSNDRLYGLVVSILYAL